MPRQGFSTTLTIPGVPLVGIPLLAISTIALSWGVRQYRIRRTTKRICAVFDAFLDELSSGEMDEFMRKPIQVTSSFNCAPFQIFSALMSLKMRKPIVIDRSNDFLKYVLDNRGAIHRQIELAVGFLNLHRVDYYEQLWSLLQQFGGDIGRISENHRATGTDLPEMLVTLGNSFPELLHLCNITQQDWEIAIRIRTMRFGELPDHLASEAVTETCMITNEAFQPDSLIALLPCNHYAGLEAMNVWLRRDSDMRCPFCRRDIRGGGTL